MLEDDGLETEIGSIGAHFDGWRWAIDNVIPMRDEDTAGIGKDRNDCTRQFRAAWEKFSADPARLTEFLRAKAPLRCETAAVQRERDERPQHAA